MREKLAIPEAEWPQAISELRSLNHIEEAFVLSTCNRIEIYVLGLSGHHGVKEVTEWMSKRSGIPVSEICQHRLLLYNKDAMQHLFEVSAGLDSLVLGEGLFDHAIKAGRRVREEINIAAGAVSVSYAAVELALAKLSESSSSAKMLVIGAGKMRKLVIKHLVAKGYTKIVVVNRSEEKVATIREEMSPGVEIIYKPFDEMLACAAEANVIFTSTGSETPLFLKEYVKIFLPAANARLFVDISVPRNVGSCVAELDGARVYNVDDLEEVVAANKEERVRKEMGARPIIIEETKKFEASTNALEVVPTIKKLRGKTEIIIVTEVEKFVSKLGIDINEETRKAIGDLNQGIMCRTKIMEHYESVINYDKKHV
ncbi:hypothetical protein AALP_AA1G230500 [Arabis alpina]|nr:hypothetical protein AALP_AA1G230500 [Arabis alpina]